MASLCYTLRIILFFGLALNIVGCSNNVEYTPPEGSTEIAITYYTFGRMVIDGKDYNGDLAILPGGNIQDWSFNGVTHLISSNDFKSLITDEVEVLIIGTGYNGAASLTAEGKEEVEQIKARGIQVQVMPTSDAVKLFNASSKKGLLACFHLNC